MEQVLIEVVSQTPASVAVDDEQKKMEVEKLPRWWEYAELVWRLLVAVVAVLVEVSGWCPLEVSARAVELSSAVETRSSASRSSLAVVLRRRRGGWRVLVRRALPDGQEWEWSPGQTRARPIACWRDEQLSVVVGNDLFVFDRYGRVVETRSEVLSGVCVGAGYCGGGGDDDYQLLWTCSSRGVLSAAGIGNISIGFAARSCWCDDATSVRISGPNGAEGVFRLDRRRGQWSTVESRPPHRYRGVDPRTYLLDWTKFVAVLDATPATATSSLFFPALVEGVASTLVATRPPESWGARKLLGKEACLVDSRLDVRGGALAESRAKMDAIIDATEWAIDDVNSVGFLVAVDGGLAFWDPSTGRDGGVKRCVVANDDGSSQLENFSSTLVSLCSSQRWFARIRADGLVVVYKKASEARLVERAAKSSLHAAVVVGRRHGAKSERAAREARWLAARDVAALNDCPDNDEEALAFVVDAAATAVLPTANQVREAHRAGRKALQQQGLGDVDSESGRKLDAVARRFDLYLNCCAAEDSDYAAAEDDLAPEIKAHASSALALAIEVRAEPPKMLTWTYFLSASDDQVCAALASGGYVSALEKCVAAGLQAASRRDVVELIPETLSPARYDVLLAAAQVLRDSRWVADRARHMDAKAGQIANAEKLLSLASGVNEDPNIYRLRRDAWHLARLVFLREAAGAFLTTTLAAWEAMSTAAKVAAVLNCSSTNDEVASLTAPLLSSDSKVAYEDAEFAVAEVASTASEWVVAVRAVACAKRRLNTTLGVRLGAAIIEDKWASTDSGLEAARAVLLELDGCDGGDGILEDLATRCDICELLRNGYDLDVRLDEIGTKPPRIASGDLAARLVSTRSGDDAIATKLDAASESEIAVVELSRRHVERRPDDPSQFAADIDALVGFGLWNVAEATGLKRLARRAVVARLYEKEENSDSTALRFVLDELKDDEAADAVAFAIENCIKPKLLCSPKPLGESLLATLDEQLLVAERRNINVARTERRAVLGFALVGGGCDDATILEDDSLLATIVFGRDDDRWKGVTREAQCAVTALEIVAASRDDSSAVNDNDSRPAMDETSLDQSSQLRRWALDRLSKDVDETAFTDESSVVARAARLMSRPSTRAEAVSAAAGASLARCAAAAADDACPIALGLSRTARSLLQSDKTASAAHDVVVTLAVEAARLVCANSRVDREARRFVAASALRLPDNSPRSVQLLDEWSNLGDETAFSDTELATRLLLTTSSDAGDEALAALASSLPVASLDGLASRAAFFADIDTRLAGEEIAVAVPNTSRSRRQKVVIPDETLVSEVVALGFSRNAALRAAVAVENRALDQALRWCFEHSNDVEVDAPFEQLQGNEPVEDGKDDNDDDSRRRIAANVGLAYFRIAVETSHTEELREASRQFEAAAHRRCLEAVHGAALRKALQDDDATSVQPSPYHSPRPSPPRERGDFVNETPKVAVGEKELLLRAARSTTAATALETAFAAAQEHGATPSELALAHLESVWDEALSNGRMDELRDRLLPEKVAARQAALDAGVGPTAQTLRSSTAKAISTLRETSPAALTEWIKQRYAKETQIEPMTLVCELAKSYSNEREFSTKALEQRRGLNSLARALHVSSFSPTTHLNAKKLLGDLLEDDPDRGDESAVASEEIGKVADAANVRKLCQLATRWFKGVTPAVVCDRALRNEIASCVRIAISDDDDDDDLYLSEIAATVKDRVKPVLSELVKVGGDCSNSLCAAFAAQVGVLPTQRVRAVAAATVEALHSTLAARLGTAEADSLRESFELLVLAALDAVSLSHAEESVVRAAAAGLSGDNPQIEDAAVAVAKKESAVNVRTVVEHLAVVARSTRRVNTSAILSTAFSRASEVALASLNDSPVDAVSATQALLERVEADETARNAVVERVMGAVESASPPKSASLARALGELSAMVRSEGDGRPDCYFAVCEIVALSDFDEPLSLDSTDSFPQFFRSALAKRGQTEAELMWKLLEALSTETLQTKTGATELFVPRENRDDLLVAAALGDQQGKDDDTDDELAPCWFELLEAFSASEESIFWLSRAGCPSGITYSMASELAALDALPSRTAIRVGLLSRFSDVRRDATLRLSSSAEFDLRQLALRAGFLDLLLDNKSDMVFDTVRAEVDRDEPDDAVLFDSSRLAIGLFLFAAGKKGSLPDVLAACDLAATMLGVHPALRTVETAFQSCQAAFDSDTYHGVVGWLCWPELCRQAREVLSHHFI